MLMRLIFRFNKTSLCKVGKRNSARERERERERERD